jgi:3-oxoacyl-[acyl-carrier-protein] synthase III
MDSKACTKCLEVKPLSDFYKDKSKKDGFRAGCKKCVYQQNTEWRKENPEFIRKANKKQRKKYNEWNKKAIEMLSDRYIKEILKDRGFTKEQITPELIAMKREQLELKRLSKQLKQEASK